MYCTDYRNILIYIGQECGTQFLIAYHVKLFSTVQNVHIYITLGHINMKF